MRILYISFHAPPYNTPGSIRVNKNVSQLRTLGHVVRILCAQKPKVQQAVVPNTLPATFPKTWLHACPWIDINRAPSFLYRKVRKVWSLFRRQHPIEPSSSAINLAGAPPAIAAFGRWYGSFLHVPDSRIGWLPFALSRGIKLCDSFHPDIIVASALPITDFVLGYLLNLFRGIPWVAEYRDFWSDSSFYAYLPWRRVLDARLERFLLKSSKGIIAVSSPMAHQLKAIHKKDTCVILNGFTQPLTQTRVRTRNTRERLTLAYFGTIYFDRGGPESLLAALTHTSLTTRELHIDFYVPDGTFPLLTQMVHAMNVGSYVSVHHAVSYRHAQKLQTQADILLLLLWQHHGNHVFTTKFFDYLGSLRPILAIGDSNNIAAQWIRKHKVGTVANSPKTIATTLKHWHENKKINRLPKVPKKLVAPFHHKHQATLLSLFLGQCANSGNVS